MELNEILSAKQEIYEAFRNIAQPRTNFQLKKFVIEDHVTQERQYMQCVLELQRKYSAIKRASIEQRKLLRKLEQEKDELERELIEIELEDLQFALEGAIREFETLYAIFKSMPKYTYEQLQEAEEKYWIKRLSIQAMIDMQSTGYVSRGNLDALRQLGLVDAEKLCNNFIEFARGKEGINDTMLQIPAERS